MMGKTGFFGEPESLWVQAGRNAAEGLKKGEEI